MTIIYLLFFIGELKNAFYLLKNVGLLTLIKDVLAANSFVSGSHACVDLNRKGTRLLNLKMTRNKMQRPW